MGGQGVIGSGRFPSGWTKKKQTILMMHLQGKSMGEIAQKVGYKDHSFISRLMKREDFQIRMRDLEEKTAERAREIFRKHAIESVEKIVNIMKEGTGDQRLQFEAAKEILYQIGCKPVDVVEKRERQYSPEEVKSAMLVMKEVEQITDRLTGDRSKFIIEKKAEGASLATPTPAPVCSSDEPIVENSPKSEEEGASISGESPIKAS